MRLTSCSSLYYPVVVAFFNLFYLIYYAGYTLLLFEFQHMHKLSDILETINCKVPSSSQVKANEAITVECTLTTEL